MQSENLLLPYVDVDLEVEEHEEHEGEDAEGDEAEPVVRDGVGRVLAELGHVEAGAEKVKSMFDNFKDSGSILFRLNVRILALVHLHYCIAFVGGIKSPPGVSSGSY